MSKTLDVLFIQLLLVHFVTQSHLDIVAVCGEDAVLPCPDLDLTHRNFHSVIWSKTIAKGKRGIIRWSATGMKKYNFTRNAAFGESHSLVLSEATPDDSGKYECAIKANVGGQNRYPNVDLTVQECVTQFERTSSTSTLTLSDHNEVHDLSLVWIAVGFMAVALTKVALSFVSVWVIHKRSSGQRHDRWTLGVQMAQKSSY